MTLNPPNGAPNCRPWLSSGMALSERMGRGLAPRVTFRVTVVHSSVKSHTFTYTCLVPPGLNSWDAPSTSHSHTPEFDRPSTVTEVPPHFTMIPAESRSPSASENRMRINGVRVAVEVPGDTMLTLGGLPPPASAACPPASGTPRYSMRTTSPACAVSFGGLACAPAARIGATTASTNDRERMMPGTSTVRRMTDPTGHGTPLPQARAVPGSPAGVNPRRDTQFRRPAPLHEVFGREHSANTLSGQSSPVPNDTIACSGHSRYLWMREERSMDRDTLLARITMDPNVCFGKPCIRGHRIWVSLVLDFLADGMTIDDVVAQYPGLTSEDVRACIAYGAEMARERYVDVSGAGA